MLGKKKFPIKVLPQEDELLSSWLVRLAIAHGQKLHTFTRLLWNKAGIWARDIDKSVTKEQIEVLADRCGINFEVALSTTFESYKGWIYENHKSLGPNPWLSTVGVYHRKRIKFGQQFCPKCLSEDSTPYFRRYWRLSFFTVCTKHKTPLFDCCPRCSFPINFHRDELGNYHSFAPNRVTRCFNCQRDLRKKPPIEIDALKNEAEFYERLHKTIETGFWQLTPNRPIHSLAFFAGLRQILKILSMNNSRINDLKKELPHLYHHPISNNRKTIDFPELRVIERRNLMLMASYLLENWSTDFVQLSRKYHIWSSLWLKHLEQKRNNILKSAPFWFWETINECLIHRKYQPTTTEINAAVKWLTKNNQPIVAFRICRLLDNYSQNLKKRIPSKFSFIQGIE